MRWYAFCSLLVRSLFCTCPVCIRSCSVDLIHDRTTTGHATDVTYVQRTIPDKNVLSISHALRLRFTRYKSVTSTVISVNWTLFVLYMCVNLAVIVRFMRPIHRSREHRAAAGDAFRHRITFCRNFSIRLASVNAIRCSVTDTLAASLI